MISRPRITYQAAFEERLVEEARQFKEAAKAASRLEVLTIQSPRRRRKAHQRLNKLRLPLQKDFVITIGICRTCHATLTMVR